MSNYPTVVIAVGRCCTSNNLFGIRIEEVTVGSWQADWSFKLRAEVAKREKYGDREICGGIGFSPHYPGCPWCSAPSAFRCDCGKVACLEFKTRKVTCPWCGATGTLGGAVTRMATSGDY